MAALSKRDSALFLTFSGILVTVVLFEIDVVFSYILRFLFCLGMFTLFYYFTSPLRHKVSDWWHRFRNPPPQGLSASENEELRSRARDRVQERHTEQGSAVKSTPGSYGNAAAAGVFRQVSLPEEPPEGGTDVIYVILRTPQGHSFRRRFLRTDSVQLLLDYMTSVGYHHRFYCLALTFPRRVISRDPVAMLQDIGIDRDSAINIEEKDENED